MSPENVALHQKARLQGAVVEAIARQSYADTTLRKLVALAGVSKTTFYEHFESREACFLATFDEIVERLSACVRESYHQPTIPRDRLRSGLSTLMQKVVEEPAAAALVAVESLTLGAAGIANRDRAFQGFEALVQESFERSSSALRPSQVTVRTIVAGIRGVIYRHIRGGRQEELPGLVGELTDWTFDFQLADDAAAHLAAATAARRVPSAPLEQASENRPPSWDEAPDSGLSRKRLNQRERIVRGAARLVAKDGYRALSIPAISSAAGVSNQTFYEHFKHKRDPLLAAFEILAAEALSAVAVAYSGEENQAEAIGVGMRALLEHIAAHEQFTRLAFLELPTAGPIALDLADETLDKFGACLELGGAPSGAPGPAPTPLRGAVQSGIWAVIRHEVHEGREKSLPRLAPEIARIALTASSRP